MDEHATSILLAGSAPFALALLCLLTDDHLKVVGWARDANDMGTLVDTLRPDVVLLESELRGFMEQLMRTAGVVAISPPELLDAPDGARGIADRGWSQHVQAHLEVVKTALALAVTTPVPPMRSLPPAMACWASGSSAPSESSAPSARRP